MSLTDRQIRNARPKSSVYRLRDVSPATKGLGIAIAPAGSKTFFLGYTSPLTGKRTQISLGRYPIISLKEARFEAQRLRQQIASEVDPKKVSQERREGARRLAERPTVRELFNHYIGDLEFDGKRSAPEVRRIFEKHVAEVMGDMVAAEIGKEDVLDVLAPIVQRGATVHADNVRAYLRAAFEFGIQAASTARWRGRMPDFQLTYNPVASTRRATKRKPVGTRVLSKEEVTEVWHRPGLSPSSRLAIKLLIAAGQRVEEVLQASWSEFDLAASLWIIPAMRRKSRHDTDEPHVVPLTGFHLKLLDDIRMETNHETWLFPHRDGAGPRKADALYQAVSRFCRTSGLASFAPRDCRRTFKTLTGSIGMGLEIRNRLQGHAMTDVGSIHYGRWDYLPQKKEAMEAWTSWLDDIVTQQPS